jgi:hypothetical protein
MVNPRDTIKNGRCKIYCLPESVKPMEKRLKKYMEFLRQQLKLELSPQDKEKLKGELLVQIGFFQHERLIHLIVTITFALLAFLTFFFSLTLQSIGIYLLLALLLVLLIPYIRHYYILENGVQKLYGYYDRLK